MGGESTKHKVLKEKAVQYLKNIGHRNIEKEYVIKLNDKVMNSEGSKFIKYDVAALDGNKTIIEVGNLDAGYTGEERIKVAEEHGFKLVHWPYSKVVRIDLDIYLRLMDINKDLDEAIENLLQKQTEIIEDNESLTEERVKEIVKNEIDKIRGNY